MSARRRYPIRFIITLLFSVLLVPLTMWGAGALWLRLPLAAVWRGTIAALFVAVMLAGVVLLWKRQPGTAIAIIVPLWVLLLGWWGTILPSNERHWQPDVAHGARATISGEVLTVEHVRNFSWRSPTDFDERWETRRYDLSRLQGADLFLSYWTGEAVAHAIVSFTFANSDPLAFSIEIRKEVGERYSSTAGFFKTYELVVLAADERDIVKVRSTVRGEDVRLFRLDLEPRTVRGLLSEYVALANAIGATPRWYHTLSANCATVIYGMARRLDPGIRPDWRILVTGYLPSYLRDKDFISRDTPLPELIAAGRIGPRAAAPPPDPEFSARIRLGVPYPKSPEPEA